MSGTTGNHDQPPYGASSSIGPRPYGEGTSAPEPFVAPVGVRLGAAFKAWVRRKLALLGFVAVLGAGGLFVTDTINEAAGVDQPGPAAPVEVGEKTRDGLLSFTVTRVRTHVGDLAQGPLAPVPTGEFVLVDVTVKNVGDNSQTLLGDLQKLYGSDGQQYPLASAATLALDPDHPAYSDLPPGRQVKATLVYDLPADVDPARIELHDQAGSPRAVVQL